MYKIGFIGCGHMGEAMLSGLLKAQWTAKEEVFVSTKTKDRSLFLQNTYGVHIANTNIEVARHSDVLILAVKPNMYASVIEEIKSDLRKETILVSITPSFSLAALQALVDNRCQVVRTMPNTPAMVGYGFTGISFLEDASSQNKEIITSLFQSFGQVLIVEEKYMPMIGTLSGSGPAFVDYLMKAFVDYGTAKGLEEETAKNIVLETFLGAVLLAKQSNEPLDTLIKNVCSPGGSTIAGIHAMENRQINEQIQDCIDQTTARFLEMSQR